MIILKEVCGVFFIFFLKNAVAIKDREIQQKNNRLPGG
jgi:hypothetical protein